ncbi:MAG: alpha-N-arabinofuranosidase [Bacteroidales bacterium]|nr:alpha-N-arabinofuranosidase [Candidatus Cryptobacteroides caccocaballi]
MKHLFTTAAALAACMTLGAQTRVHIQDNDANGQIIPKEIYGQFSEHLGRCIYDGIWVGKDSPVANINGYRLDVMNALKDLSVPVMRWPGGCFADDYHWMDGIGPQENRTKISNNNWGGTLEDNSFGTHEFLDFCEMIGCQPYISGNVGSGTVEEMAKWVEYMTSDSKSTVVDMRRANGREKAWDVKYFGVGNEAWGCGGNMTPAYYSDVFRRYNTYLRDYSREHNLYRIASGASDTDYNWTETCVNAIKNQMDAIAVHYYTCFGWGPGDKGYALDFDNDVYYRTLGRAVGIDDCIQKHIAIMDKYDPKRNIDLLVDEWGTWWEVEPGTDPGHLYQQATMRDAIVAALSLNIFHKYTYRLKMCNIAQVVNVLQAMILTQGDQMVLTPTYHVFKMYKAHMDAEYIPVSFAQRTLTTTDLGAVPELSVTASRKDGVMNVTLVNPALDKKQSIVLDWDTIGSKKVTVNGEIITCKDIKDYNDFGKAPMIATKDFKDYKVAKDGITIELPAKSIVNICIK